MVFSVQTTSKLTLAVFMLQCYVTYGITFAPGAMKNKTILSSFHLNLIKKKLEREINKYRGNGNVTEEIQTTAIPEDHYDDEIKEEENPLIFSLYQGKNLLKFKLTENEITDDTELTRVNLWVHVWKKERKRRRPRIGKLKKKVRKGKLIRIRVFSVKDEKQKGKKIAEFRTRIQKTKWYKISLPVSVIQNPSTHVNDTVLLRVECKRCNRKTQLVLPEDQKCRKRKKKSKNKNRKGKGKNRKDCGTMRVANSVRRPFIVLEKRRKEVRSRRSLVENCEQIPTGTTYTGQCCKLPSFVNFSDLGLDDRIVTPNGYMTGSCIGRCPRTRHNGRRNNRDQTQIPTERSRSRRSRCKPAETSSLTVLLFNENHDLMQAELSGLVVNSCTCR